MGEPLSWEINRHCSLKPWLTVVMRSTIRRPAARVTSSSLRNSSKDIEVIDAVSSVSDWVVSVNNAINCRSLDSIRTTPWYVVMSL